MRKTALFVSAGALALALMDQGTKWLAAAYLREPVAVTSWFILQYRQNTGIAWSIQMPYALLMALNFSLVALFFYFTARYFDIRNPPMAVATALITAGACGNIVDRLAHGYVVDFISVGMWPVFNLADTFLTVGIFLILLFYGRIKRN